MIQKTTLQFLTELKKNNTKEWFDANRKRYESSKEDVQNITGELIKAIGVHDEDIAQLQVKECTFRINRDVRFSKNKAPYKSNISAIFSKGGKKADTAGFYLHIEPGAAFVAAGYWSPEAKKLASVRQEIDYNLVEWKKILSSKKFKQHFTDGLSKEDTLQRPPKGYDEENPAIEYLKLKSFIVTKKITDAELQDKNYTKNIVSIFTAVKPMLDFLNTAE
ncbi:MAG: DUF2461 domain-containing protein [Ferruginibacter sp.]|nr:DUF2461 domain-containing protein [Ferruginibacter sp.]